MKTKEKKEQWHEILKEIRENGGFDNLNRWSEKEIAEYIFSNFYCTKYTAKKVAYYLS
jgi:hypothetical protein